MPTRRVDKKTQNINKEKNSKVFTQKWPIPTKFFSGEAYKLNNWARGTHCLEHQSFKEIDLPKEPVRQQRECRDNWRKKKSQTNWLHYERDTREESLSEFNLQDVETR